MAIACLRQYLELCNSLNKLWLCQLVVSMDMSGAHFYCHAQLSFFALRGIPLGALLLSCVGGVEF